MSGSRSPGCVYQDILAPYLGPGFRLPTSVNELAIALDHEGVSDWLHSPPPDEITWSDVLSARQRAARVLAISHQLTHLLNKPCELQSSSSTHFCDGLELFLMGNSLLLRVAQSVDANNEPNRLRTRTPSQSPDEQTAPSSQNETAPVFLCHSGSYKSLAIKLHLMLKGRGVESNIDRLCLQASTKTFPDQIKSQIDNARIFVALVGNDFMTNKWCVKELEQALRNPALTIIPVFIHGNRSIDIARAANPQLTARLRQHQGVVSENDVSDNTALIGAFQSVHRGLGKPPPTWKESVPFLSAASAVASDLTRESVNDASGNLLARLMSQRLRDHLPGDTYSLSEPFALFRLAASKSHAQSRVPICG